MLPDVSGSGKMIERPRLLLEKLLFEFLYFLGSMKLLSGMPEGALGGKERMLGATSRGHEGSCVKRVLFSGLGR